MGTTNKFDATRAALLVMLHEARELNTKFLRDAGMGVFDLNAIRQAEEALAAQATQAVSEPLATQPAEAVAWRWTNKRTGASNFQATKVEPEDPKVASEYEWIPLYDRPAITSAPAKGVVVAMPAAAQRAFDSYMARRENHFWREAIWGFHPHEFWFAAWNAALQSELHISEFERDFPPGAGLTECDMGDSYE